MLLRALTTTRWKYVLLLPTSPSLMHVALLPRFVVVLLLILVSAENLSAAHNSPPIHEQEITHLLNFIENSGCIFIRNNKRYDGKRARDHLNTKYQYIQKRETNVSAEQFIQYAASQSSLSKKPYTVQCGSADPILSDQWLSRELNQFRQSR